MVFIITEQLHNQSRESRCFNEFHAAIIRQWRTPYLAAGDVVVEVGDDGLGAGGGYAEYEEER
jgi:hypothetical protein